VIEVRRVGSLAFDADGKPSGGVAGARIIHYTYDGLGRLIRAQRPMPDDVNPLAPTRFRTERYFYDGVRRVQEVVTEDLPVIVIGDPIPMQGEAEATGEPLPDGPGGEPPGGPPVATLPWTGREYVYAPPSAAGMGPGHGGGSSAVDDFIAQVDNAEAWVFMIQDVHGDVVALASETGAILARYAYDGFGRILLSEHDAAGTGPHGTQSIKPTANRVGHKGLFFDRYDTPHAWVPGSGIDGLPPTLAAPTTGSVGQAGSWASGGVKGLYYNRNRHFSPNLGRFVQRDPNATGLVLAAVPAMHGQQVMTGLQPFDAEFHYIDGPNTHTAYDGGPTLYSNPMGLFSLGELSAAGGIRGIQSEYDENVLEAGQSIFSMISGMLFSAGFDQLLDSSWASDWVEPDDLYSKSSEFATGTGSWTSSDDGGMNASSDSGPAVAGKKLPKLLPKIKELVKGSARDAKGRGVYIVKDKDGNVLYVGRSKDLQRRMADQQARFGKDVQITGISVGGKNAKNATRALEDYLIRKYKEVGLAQYNKINGIAESNRKAKPYYNALWSWIK
jgi:YD repeat-containing protein